MEIVSSRKGKVRCFCGIPTQESQILFNNSNVLDVVWSEVLSENANLETSIQMNVLFTIYFNTITEWY